MKAYYVRSISHGLSWKVGDFFHFIDETEA